jgi:hypothetical protein
MPVNACERVNETTWPTLTFRSCAKHDSAARSDLLDWPHPRQTVSTQPTRHIIAESEQMRARLDALARENDALKALIDIQFLRIHSYPRATLSTGTLAERRAQLAAFPTRTAKRYVSAGDTHRAQISPLQSTHAERIDPKARRE